MHRTQIAAMVTGLLLASATASAQVTFVWCGGIPNGEWLNVTGVAAGGAAVVGTANFPAAGGATTGRAYRWTAATGIVNLGTLPSTLTYPYSDAYSVSADGQVVVGRSYTTGDRGFRWSGGAMVELPVLPGGASAIAQHIAADGSVVTGSCWVVDELRAVRWTGAGIEDLGIPPWRTRAVVQGASSDGRVIAGYAYTVFAQDDRAFVLEGGVWTDLGVLPGTTRSSARSVSADGTVVVGTSRSPFPALPQAFMWTRGAGMRPIPLPLGVTAINPLGVSGDGSVIVGGRTVPGVPNADGFVWTPWEGARGTGDVLRGFGIDLTNWSEVLAWSVTPDGRTLAGTARGSPGFRAWVATLPEGFGCYANCDGSTTAPAVNVADFVCFLNKFAASDPGANCDGSTVAPVLNVADFICFMTKYAAGCP